jgi:hypothetical protein
MSLEKDEVKYHMLRSLCDKHHYLQSMDYGSLSLIEAILNDLISLKHIHSRTKEDLNLLKEKNENLILITKSYKQQNDDLFKENSELHKEIINYIEQKNLNGKEIEIKRLNDDKNTIKFLYEESNEKYNKILNKFNKLKNKYLELVSDIYNKKINLNKIFDELDDDSQITLEKRGIYNNNNNNDFTFEYSPSNKKITFFFILHNLDSIKISLKYIITNKKNKFNPNFYQFFYISKKFQYSNLNFSLKISNNFNVLKYNPIILHRMAKNNYFYFGMVPKNGIFLTFSLTPNFVKYKVTYKETFNLLPNKKTYFFMPKYFCGGNIKNISYNIKSSMSETIDDEYIKENRSNFILTFPPKSKENENGYFQITSELYVFSLIKSGDISKFNGPNIGINLDNFKYTNFTKKILEEDKKDMPSYIKIGKWIKKNITYDISYLSKKMTIDEILNIKKGVCVHFTKLFNALLNSINIPSEHIWGFVIEKNKQTAHAWSIFLYENEWKFADCTMGYFRGVIPCSHLMWNRAVCGRKCTPGIISKVERNIELIDE